MSISLGKLARRLGIYRHRRLAGRLLFRPADLYAVWQEEHLARLFELLKVDCVFDVGANRGQFVTMLRERVGYQGLIFSFEPIPELAALLRESSQADPDWHIEELAISEDDGQTPFNVMEVSEFSSVGTPSHEDSGLFRSLNAVQESIVVPTETLATAWKRLQQQHGFSRPFLKLDTQGLDVSIVAASADMLRNFVAVQSELAIKRLYEESVDFRQALDVYERCGFSPAMFLGMNPDHFPLMVEADCLLVRNDLLPEELG